MVTFLGFAPIKIAYAYFSSYVSCCYRLKSPIVAKSNGRKNKWIVAVEILDVHLHPIRDGKDTILFYIERTPLTVFSLLVRYTMCILLTPVLYFITTVIIEVYLQCFTESVSLRHIGKPTSRAELSSPSCLYLKVVKGAHIGSALTGATSEFANSNRKKNSLKIHYSLLRKKLRTRLHSFLLFVYLKFRKKGNTNTIKNTLLIFKHRKNLKKDHHVDQPSSMVPTHSDELQLADLTQPNKRLTHEANA